MGIKFNSESEYTLEIAIRLSLQRALLCEISSNLRMVAVDWDNNKIEIILYFYFDGFISQENKDSVNCITGEFSGDFDQEAKMIEKSIRWDFPKELPLHMCTVFRRLE